MCGVKTYAINRKEALTGDWAELNKKAYVCNVCLQNNFKVYFCTQISINNVYLKRAQKNYIKAIIKWMNFFFTTVVLHLKKFLTTDFNKQE